MEEPEKGLSTCRASEPTVAYAEKMGGETLEGSVEGSFSEELVGEGGGCNGKDVMVEVMGSDVYIDGVSTHGSGAAELNDEVGCGGSVEGGEDLDKDVKSAGVGSGSEAQLGDSRAAESEEARSENAAVAVDGMVLEREVRVGSDECDDRALLDDRAQKEVGTGVSDSHSAVNTTSGNIEVPIMVDAGAPDHKVTNTRCDNALGCSLTGSSVGGENVQSRQDEKDDQKDRNVIDNVAPEDENDVTLETLGEQKNFGNLQSDKMLDKEACDLPKGMEIDVEDQPTEQCDLDKGMEIDVEDQPEAERNKIMDQTAENKGTSVSFGGEENVDADAIVEKDTQITDQGDGNENFNDESNIGQNVEDRTGISEQVSSSGGQEIEEEFNEAEHRKSTDGRATRRASMKLGSSETFHQARYSLSTEKEGEFSVSDMVWGKVRSHPWWPGQIFDPSDSSERAMKHYKKDCYLVAYFGDRTFAWNEASQLKPFRTHFSSIEKHSTSESFQNAVECAVDEVTRRVEYGLACSCIPKDTYDTIKLQTVENTGIRQEVHFRHGVDESLNASSFSPSNLIEYLKTLSELPTGGFDRLELGIAKGQLLAFYRFKGYSCLPELQYCGDLDNDTDSLSHDDEKKMSEGIEHATPAIKNYGQAGVRSSSRHKRKHNLKDAMHPTKKERRLSELMGGTPDSPDGDYWSDEKLTDNLVSPGHSKKRRAIDHYADESGMQDERKTISLAKVSNTTKPSFKIGDCIRRVASQLTASPSMLKCSSDQSQKTDLSFDGFPWNESDVSLLNFDEAQRSSVNVPTEYSSLDELLSSLHWVAQEPHGEHSFLNAIVSFFSDFRNSVIVAPDSGIEMLYTDKVGAKRKKPPIGGSPETFEFEDMSDTYWTDRVIDNGNEEQLQPVQPVQPSRKNRKKDSAEPGRLFKLIVDPIPGNNILAAFFSETPEKPPGYIDENAPAELVMNFAELDSVPSEANLNRMFRRFGPLKESETEVDRVSSRARVVFKKCVDAEVACSSAKKFNIFGAILVNYQLNYTPSALFKASSVATTQDQDMHLDLSNFEVNMV